MRYLFTHAWKLQGIFAVLIVLSLTGCTEYDVKQSSTGSGNNCFTATDATEDSESNSVDCSSTDDHSVTTPPAEVIE